MAEPSKLLRAWGLADASFRLVATRENTVYRAETRDGPVALRLRRPGYRSVAEIRSELDWMAALNDAGFPVPRPIPTREGAILLETNGFVADIVTWLSGTPMGIDGALTMVPDLPERYMILGRTAALMHDISDAWPGAARVTRPAWDANGLLGDTPLWGRFWENPVLDDDQRTLIRQARAVAATHLADAADGLDYGLIHADLTPENVIFGLQGPAVIDFDDGGWGFRAFELATVANRALRHPDGKSLISGLLDGYQSVRPVDVSVLPLFQLLRSFTYLGWIVPRMDEPGAKERSARFTEFATRMARDYLENEGAVYAG